MGLAQLTDLRAGDAGSSFISGFVDGVDLADAVESSVGPGINHGPVEHAENRNRSANSESKREDCGQGKAWVFPDLAEGKADILPECLHVNLASGGRYVSVLFGN